MLYSNIASVYAANDNSSESIKYKKKALPIALKYVDSSHPTLATIYNNLAAYENLDDYERALVCYQKAIDFRKNAEETDDSKIAQTYRHIASLYDTKEDYKLALDHYQMMLECQLKSQLPLKHPELATTYDFIGWTHYKNDQSQLALKFMKKGLNIRLKNNNSSDELFST
ncbi:unnamed protein product, partial [Didymodactylos carnosus]